MIREHVPIAQLSAWMQFNEVELHRIAITPGEYGSAITAVTDVTDDDPVLMKVPSDLILTMEKVYMYAKSDRHLLQVLDNIGDFSRTPRGAILIFLLLQITHNASIGAIGVSNPFNHYIKTLPQEILLPSFWNEAERILLKGTSLQAALHSKISSLEKEFSLLRDSTSSIAWCNEYWWGANSEGLTVSDWMYVDAAYRSRALELPGTGHAMVPCIDMANHASGTKTNAIYEADIQTGNMMLLLRDDQKVGRASEVTITYGDDKGACEMLFSYGFLEDDMSDAKEMFLSIGILDDDPLGSAKRTASRSPPGFKLYRTGSTIEWEGPFVWLICVNEEDGLEFQIAQETDGSSELLMTFNGKLLEDASKLQSILEAEPMWDVFRLRATTVVQSCVEQQLLKLQSSQDQVAAVQERGAIRSTVEGFAIELRDLEETFLLEAYEILEDAKVLLIDSVVVQNYLNSPPGLSNATSTEAQEGAQPLDEHDFS